jgi:hypothetical protein
MAVPKVNDVVHVTPYNLVCTNVSEKCGASCVKLEDRYRFRQCWYLSIELQGLGSRKAISVET